jgi:predicted AlkP superfamily phosphohydrolase/phosphomutase
VSFPEQPSVPRLSRRSVLAVGAAAAGSLSAFLLADGLARGLPPRPPAPAADAAGVPRVVVLGFDGVDHQILKEYLAAGELPALSALAQAGGFEPLESELPPESPVAWASLLTGVNPGRHRIHDFVIPERDMTPVNGMVDVRPLRLLWGKVPVRKPEVRSRLAAPTFLERVHAAGYPVVSLRQPHLFPAPALPGARLLAGLGTPDISGAAGAYSMWSARIGYTSGVTEFGGKQFPLRAGAVAGRYETVLEGPPDPSLGRDADGLKQHAAAPLVFERAALGDGRPGVRITLDGRSVVLAERERSDFLAAEFRLRTLPRVTVHGLVRFEVRSLEPLEMLADPVQIDPRRPSVPLTAPAGYGAELFEAYGPFETMGWREQTFALNDERQDDEAFLRDALDDIRRDAAMLFGELARGGKCVFQCFTATDRVSHCFFHLRDRGHFMFHRMEPEARARLGDPILTIYREMDAIVARVRAALGPDDLLLVCSDHGFQTWRWGFNVNQWLEDRGWLVRKGAVGAKGLRPFFDRADPGLDAIDWTRTKAVALGLGQVFLNVRGRQANGSVDPADVPALRQEIAARLLELRNPWVPDEAPVRRVFFLHEEYTGPYREEAGDIQIGFAPGYRVSWQTALLGGFGAGAIERNLKRWSGDHCSTDPATVPGVVLSNRRIAPAPPDRRHHVRDVAATVLAHFGLAVDDLDGRPLPLGPR